jgi:multidrug efflux pump subunit AcrB
MERIVRFFVERHLLVNVVTIAILAAGIMTAARRNVEGFPTVDMPRFMIMTSLPGASARDVEAKVAIPLEEALREVDGLDNYTSVISDNRSVTEVELDDDTPRETILEKEREIRTAIDGITDFPAEMTDEPSVLRLDPSKSPVLEIALSGEASLLPAVAKRLERRLLRADGVGKVTVVGLPDPELRVFVDPQRSRAHGVTLLDVVRAIERQNVSSTGGVLETSDARRQVVLWERFSDPFEVGEVILRFDENEAALRVRDVARLELGREDTGLIVGTNGLPGLSMVVSKRADADIIDTRHAILEVMADAALPPDVEVEIVNDRSFEIRNRLEVIATNGAMGLTLVAGIVFLFLAPSAALWVCLGVPLVIMGVVIFLPFFDIGINFVSTVAFVIVLGMLVDDAVVVAEKILLRRQDGLPPVAAAIEGASSVARPVVAAAVTTLLAFAPMLSIGGMPGRVIWQIPAVVCIALAMSLVESFTILPAHMSMIRGKRAAQPKRVFVLRLEQGYRRLLERGLPMRGRVIAGFAAVFLGVMVFIAPRMQFEFFPQDASPALSLKVTLPVGAPIEQSEAVLAALQAQIVPLLGDDLVAVTSRVGHQETLALDREYGSAENEGLITVHLVPAGKKRTAAGWISYLKPRLQVMEDVEIVYEAEVDGPPGLEPISVHVVSNDDALRRETALAIVDWLDAIPGPVDLSINERPGMRQIDLNVDPARLAQRGLDSQEVGQTLKAAYFGLIASEIRDLDETTEIRVLFEPAARRSLDALLQAPVRNARGELVLLRDVVSPEELPALAQIYHRNGRRVATVTGGLDEDANLTATTLALRMEDELLPRFADRDDLEVEMSGEVVQSRRATGDVTSVALLSVLGIGAVIAIMLGSFLEAFFVIVVVPFAAMAVVLTFWAHGLNFSMLPLIGTLGLAGVVVNASIIMVDAVHRAQYGLEGADDATRSQAMIDALVGRLRPILVTTLSTLGGVLPTAYGLGGYDSVMSPMSLALGWGLALSSLVTLFLVPCLYVTANDLTRRLDTWRSERQDEVDLEVAA